MLIAHALGLRRLDLYLQHDRPLTDDELGRLREAVRERGRGVPVAQLTGVREFHSLSFTVTRDVLVPRPETEGLVEVAVAFLAPVERARFVDVGTGSGCIGVSMLKALPTARAFATDVSSAALAVARGNAVRHEVADRFDAREGSLLGPIAAEPSFGALDAVVSNPPYVVRGDPTLSRDVAEHEPAVALYVEGDDSLALVRALAREARPALRPGGLLAVEIGHRDGERARALLAGAGYEDVDVIADLGGVPRVVRGTTPR